MLEYILQRATKYILNNYTPLCKLEFKKLHLLLLMYLCEIQDLILVIKSLKSPTGKFNINIKKLYKLISRSNSSTVFLL